MKNISVVTCYNKQGFYQTGSLLINSFIKFWPKEVSLRVYVDDPIPKSDLIRDPRVTYKILNIKELMDFKEKHSLNKKARGYCSEDRSSVSRVYNYRFDAVRFSHKVFALFQFLQESETDLLVWLDGDTRTHSPISIRDIESWCPNGKFAGYLARPWLYTETGFHIFDMKHVVAKDFLDAWKQYYINDSIFDLDMWTDCHTYDAAMKKFDESYWHNLSPPIKHNHPFINGPLGEFMDHMKGERKKKGTSRKKDLVVSRNNDTYWRRVT